MEKISKDILQLADALHSAAIHLLRQLRTEDRTSGIGPAQLSALSVLVFGGPLSLKHLAAIEQVRPPTMVRIVQGLVEQKLVTSKPDKTDGRKIKISATATGRSLMQRARERRVGALARMLEQKTERDLLKLRDAVVTLQQLRVTQPAPRGGSSGRHARASTSR